MGFFSNYGKNVAKDAEEGIISLIAKFDFKNASAAELDTLEGILTKTSTDLAVARNQWKKEKADVEQVVAKYNKLMGDAEKCQAAIDDPLSSDVKKQKASDYQAKAVAELEALVPEIDREKAEEADAKEFMDLLEETVRLASANLTGARKALENKKRELDTLKLQEKNNEEKVNRAKVLAGLKEQSNTMGKMLGVMDKDIEKAKISAAASKIKADAILGTLKKEQPVTDEDMADILGTTTPTGTGLSVQDRLAKLKKTV
jgi:hypothetical protein